MLIPSPVEEWCLMKTWISFSLAIFAPLLCLAEPRDEKNILVFVALCDNATQGIMPVNPRIGDGNVPSANLYWCCSDGLSSYFKKSARWTLTDTETPNDGASVLERLTFRHQTQPCTLVASAYRGSEMKACIDDYFRAIADREADLVCFIGHNGLMDFTTTLPQPPVLKDGDRPVDAISLCCLSHGSFNEPIHHLAARPILLTRQLMYPGSFVLHDVAESWLAGKSRQSFRDAAGRAMARNQKISVRAATGIFSPVEDLERE